MRSPALILVLTMVVSPSGCGRQPARSASTPGTRSTAAAQPSARSNNQKPHQLAARPGIEKLVQASPTVYSGSQPYGEEGFASLSRLGITTVVSVDGARPDVELARKHGLRYVHVPIGYDGIPSEAGRALARVARDAAGPIYVHCHHGEHRGPAATAVVCMAADHRSGDEALEILQVAGTSPDYPGLWRDVQRYEPPAADAKLPELSEVAEVASLPAAMAAIDRTMDNLKLCNKAGWSVPPQLPDLVAAQESLILTQELREVGRTSAKDRDAEFHALLDNAVSLAQRLRDSLARQQSAQASNVLDQLNSSCKQCHAKYRNAPK